MRCLRTGCGDHAQHLWHHVFVDGNKRTASIVTLEFLGAWSALADDEQADLKLALLGEVALATASGRLDVEQVTFWLRRIFEAPSDG